MTSTKIALKQVEASIPELITNLQSLIRQPSVSATNEGIEKCATLVLKIMRQSGIKAELLRLGKGIAPVIYGEVKSKRNSKKTLLFYNHYDVQPVGPIELWRHSPFSGKKIGNKIFGRGSADDKGELITRIWAVKSYLDSKLDLPCNVKFIIEGEEETGSTNIERYLKKFRKKFSCDGVIWEFGYVDANDKPIIGLGMKGLLYVELSCKEAMRDVHSSFAVLIKNPAWRLIQAVNTLRTDYGKILIKDWYKEVPPFTKNELQLISSEPFDDNQFKKEYGVRSFVGNKKGLQAKKALVGAPTCNIAGLVSGYTGKGAKTVLPSEALVKIDFRLVPNMVPKKQIKRLRDHLDSKGFGDIKINVINAEAAAKTSPNVPIVNVVKEAADESFGDSILNVSNAGTGPMHSFVKVLKAPCISVGCTYLFSRIHSPNEFTRVDLLRKATKCMCLILDKFGKSY